MHPIEQKLLLRAYRKSYMRNRLVPKWWPWPLFIGRNVVLRSCQPLRYIRRWISRKSLKIEAWFQRTSIGNGIWAINGHVIDDVTWPQRCCEAVRSAILATAWFLVLHFDQYFSSYVLCSMNDHGIIIQQRQKLWSIYHLFSSAYHV